MTPTSLLILYFTVGFVGSFPGVAATFVMVNQLHFSASEVAATALLCSIPWCLKPLWASFTDAGFPCTEYRRRPYVSLFSFASGCFIAATPRYADPSSVWSFKAMLALSSFCICFVDVSIDGSVMLLVKKESGKSTGRAQGDSWSARTAGVAIGSGFGGSVFEYMGFDRLMFLCCLLPFLCCLVALDIPDEPKATTTTTATRAREPFAVCRIVFKSMWQIRYILFAAVVVASIPEWNTSMFFYLLSNKATPKEISLVDTTASVFGLFALLGYNTCKPPHRTSFAMGIVLNCLSAFIGAMMASDSVPWLLESAALESVISAVGNTLLLMPSIVLIGKSAADTAHEATVYSFCLSLLNLASVVSETGSALAMQRLHVNHDDVNNVRTFVACISCVTLFALPVSCLLPKQRRRKAVVYYDDEEEEEIELLVQEEHRKFTISDPSSDSDSCGTGETKTSGATEDVTDEDVEDTENLAAV